MGSRCLHLKLFSFWAVLVWLVVPTDTGSHREGVRDSVFACSSVTTSVKWREGRREC